MNKVSAIKRMLMYVGLLTASLLTLACNSDEDGNSQKPPSTQGIGLRIGEAINFASGEVTNQVAEGDMVFQYMPPQSSNGWRYNPTTGIFEYQTQVATTENFPLLQASKIGSFEQKPDLSNLTAGDVNAWTDLEFNVGPGRYLVVRALTTGKHYLLKMLALEATSNDPATWVIRFEYEPVDISLGEPGSAGQNLTLSGTLTYQERFYTEKIIDLNLADGATTELFDGYGVSRNQDGTYAYIKATGELGVADAAGNVIQTLSAPAAAPPTYPDPTEVIISPGGVLLAVQLYRAKDVLIEGVPIGGIPYPTVVVLTTEGEEVAEFYQYQGAAWLPDGRLGMVSAADDPPTAIITANVETLELQEISLPASLTNLNYVAVSPDGQQLAFTGNDRVCLMQTDGSGFQQYTQSGLSELTPVWSPDGQYLAMQQFVPQSPVNAYRVVVYRLSDGKATVITDALGRSREPAGRMSWVAE